MISFDSHAGFTFSNVKLQVTEITNRQNQFIITNLDEIYFNEEIDFTNDKETKITSLFQAAFEELIIKNSIASNAVSFSLPQELFITARLPIENALCYSDLIEDYRWQLSIMYPYLNWNDFVIRFHEVDGKLISTNDTALVFALNRKHIKFITNFCRKNKLKLKFIDHCHLASINIIGSEAINKSGKILSFYISENVFSLLISIESNPIYYEDIPIRSMYEVPSMIKEKLNELNQQQLNFSSAYLFGDSASAGIAKTLTEITRINFSLVNPFTLLKANPTILTNKYYTKTNHLFPASTGIAARI